MPQAPGDGPAVVGTFYDSHLDLLPSNGHQALLPAPLHSFLSSPFNLLTSLLLESFYAGDQDDLGEGDELGEDEPVLDPLDVGGLGQLLHHADQQGGQGQHHAQVHRDRRVEEVWQPEE